MLFDISKIQQQSIINLANLAKSGHGLDAVGVLLGLVGNCLHDENQITDEHLAKKGYIKSQATAPENESGNTQAPA